jgi:hypothetical protein
MATLNSSTFLKKYNTGQNEKGNDYAFKDFIPDGVQKMTASGQSLTTTPQLQHNHQLSIQLPVYREDA